MIQVRLHHRWRTHELEVDTADAVSLLRFQLYSLTAVPPQRQLVFGIGQGALRDDANLAALGLTPGQDVVLLGAPEGEDLCEGPDSTAHDQAPGSPQAVHRHQLAQLLAEGCHASPHLGAEMRGMLDRLVSSAQHVRMYEQPDLQEQAQRAVPVLELHARARAADKPLPHFEDEMLRQLLRWYKREFFKWVNAPACQVCGKATKVAGMARPAPDEARGLAGCVEVYRCTTCYATTRFPRYNHPGTLLNTRQGRCGEWANCFALLCRALGRDTRHVVDWTDHVWVEVYSEGQARWLHADSCECALDAPLMYESGWGKALTYVVAFSRDHVVDVTRCAPVPP